MKSIIERFDRPYLFGCRAKTCKFYKNPNDCRFRHISLTDDGKCMDYELSAMHDEDFTKHIYKNM